MAKKPKKEDLDLDVEGGKKGGKLKLILIIVLSVVLLIGAGLGAAWYFLGGKLPGMAAAEQVDEGYDDEDVMEEDEDEPPVKKRRKKKRKKRHAGGPPLYAELDPDFVISFKDQRMARFMQLRLKVMSHDQAVIDAVEQYKPVLRNNLLLLFSAQKFEEIVTREGKEKLLQEAMDEINRTLDEEADSDGVEAVYFTSFVAQ